MTYAVRVSVMPKPGIADPQGQTIERALPALGFGGVSRVRVGKRIDLDLEAADRDVARAVAAEMCERLLANTVLETFEIEVR